jgi:hypothetical protein
MDQINYSPLISSIERFGPFDYGEIARDEMRQILTASQGDPISPLRKRCKELQGHDALVLCNHYFGQLIKVAPTDARALFPNSIGRLVAKVGVRAIRECGDSKEFDQVVVQINSLVSCIPGSDARALALLSSLPASPASRLVGEIARHTRGAALFHQVIACYSLEKELTPRQSLSLAKSYLKDLAAIPLSPQIIEGLKEETGKLIATYGLRNMIQCRCVEDYQQLIKQLGKLLAVFDGSARIAHSTVNQLPVTPERDLILKIIEGSQNENFFVELVIRTPDNILSSEEWDRLGRRCLGLASHPARLWLAIGANATERELILFSVEVVRRALNNNPIWSGRRQYLMTKLINNATRIMQ